MSPTARSWLLAVVVVLLVVTGAVGTMLARDGRNGAGPVPVNPDEPAASASRSSTAATTPPATIPAATASAPATPSPPPAEPTPGSTASPVQIAVTVTIAGYDASSDTAVAAGYADTVESDGTCTLRLTSGTTTATASGPAMPDATTTSCGSLSVPRSDLAPGIWQAVLEYASPSSSGQSAPMPIEIP